MTSDIDALQELISQGLVLFVQNTFLFVGAVIVVLLMSWQLALGVLVIVPPVFFASRWFRRVSNKAYLEVRDRDLDEPQHVAGEPRRRARRAGVRAGAPVHARGSTRTNEDQYEANMRTTFASPPSTSRSSSTPASPAPR